MLNTAINRKHRNPIKSKHIVQEVLQTISAIKIYPQKYRSAKQTEITTKRRQSQEELFNYSMTKTKCEKKRGLLAREDGKLKTLKLLIA